MVLMTVVADTRFLLVFTFPSTRYEMDQTREIMHRSLCERLMIPTVVVVEYRKIAGRKIGLNSVETRGQ